MFSNDRHKHTAYFVDRAGSFYYNYMMYTFQYVKKSFHVRVLQLRFKQYFVRKYMTGVRDLTLSLNNI